MGGQPGAIIVMIVIMGVATVAIIAITARIAIIYVLAYCIVLLLAFGRPPPEGAFIIIVLLI